MRTKRGFYYDDSGRVCTRCGEFKAWSEFCKAKGCTNGHNYYCRECARIRNRLNRYGITEKQYQQMYEDQNGVCAICKNPEKAKGLYKEFMALSVDHDHKTGKVRGLLCIKCNTMLGRMNDSIESFERAIEHIKRGL